MYVGGATRKPKPHTTTMWSSHYLSPPTPLHLLIPLPLTVVSAKSQPQPGQDLGGLGRSFLTKLKPNPKPTNITAVTKQQKQKQEDSSRQISGSEVLFAMQKAAAKKQKETLKKKTKTSAEGLSSVGRHREEEEDEVDYSKVRPLCLKSDWGRRLDELEMRLQELSSKTI